MLIFYITKFVQFMLLPPGIFIILFVTLRKYKKIFLITLTLFSLLSTKFVANYLIYPLEKDYLKSYSSHADIVAVLGGSYNKYAPNLQLSSDSYKRFIYAVMIAKKHGLPLIFDGSKEEAEAVANSVKELNRYLNINLPIAKDSKYHKKFIIYIQNRALTTIDNAKNIKKFFILNKIKNPNFYLVTSAYHMKRSLKEFKRVNLYPTAKATDFKSSKEFKILDLMPTAEGLNISFKALHEYLAFFRDVILRR